MSSVIRIARNARVAQLLDGNSEIKGVLQSMLSYQVAGAEYSNASKHGNWDGTSTFFQWGTGRFPAGFVKPVMTELRKRGYTVQTIQKPLPKPLGPERPEIDAFGYTDAYDYQPKAVETIIREGQGIAQCATGCHAKGQLVLMFDGSLKAVEDVEVCDMLMGPDSRPRNVMRLCRGRDQMYRITPNRTGKPFIVNGEHILSLEQTTLPEKRPESIYNGVWRELTVSEYLAENKTFRHIHKLHRSRGVSFESEDDLAVEPYLLGALLGDGSIKNGTPAVTTADHEIVTFMEIAVGAYESMKVVDQYKERNSAKTYRLTAGKRGGCVSNPLTDQLKALGLWGCGSHDKFIPHVYKVASETARLKLLAGLIDTDGSVHNGCYDYVSKSERLADDIAFVARSLGMAVHVSVKTIASGRYAGNVYYRVSICGDVSRIPVLIERKKIDPRRQKKDVCLTGFSVEALGEDDYYGFQVDDDNLYLLDDFTVTHNSGKSRIANIAVSRIRRPTLFITTRGVLMYQMKTAFEESMAYQFANGDTYWKGREVGVIGDGEWNPRRSVTVGMVQTLASRLKEPDTSKPKAEQEKQAKIRAQTLRYLELVEFVVLEEAHEVGGDSYYRIMDACKNARYRMALTATPFMRDDQESNMRLLACTGPVLIRVTEKTLIERGVLARPYFRYHTVSYAPDRDGIKSMKDQTIVSTRLGRSTGWQRAYKLGVIYNQQRNRLIIEEAVRAVSMKMPVMILVLQKNHGRLLQQRLAEAGVKARFVFGESSRDARQEALNDLRDGVTDVLIGSTIMDVGVDVPAVGCVILAGGGKAEVALRQRIGRGLRAKKNGPNVALIVDFIDNSNNHLRKHSLERLAIVQNTPGFGENVIYAPSDFDFEGVGLASKTRKVS